jgi:hypothetical protein
MGIAARSAEKARYTGRKNPKVLVRIVGQAPLAATVYSLERLRCGACGQVFTAQEPEGVGPEKYDETAAAMIAQLKYGSGTPFYRLEQLQGQLGIPPTGGDAMGRWANHEVRALTYSEVLRHLISVGGRSMWCGRHIKHDDISNCA